MSKSFLPDVEAHLTEGTTIKSDPDELVEIGGQEHNRAYDIINNAIFQDLLSEIKELHLTIKQIHNIEV